MAASQEMKRKLDACKQVAREDTNRDIAPTMSKPQRCSVRLSKYVQNTSSIEGHLGVDNQRWYKHQGRYEHIEIFNSSGSQYGISLQLHNSWFWYPLEYVALWLTQHDNES